MSSNSVDQRNTNLTHVESEGAAWLEDALKSPWYTQITRLCFIQLQRPKSVVLASVKVCSCWLMPFVCLDGFRINWHLFLLKVISHNSTLIQNRISELNGLASKTGQMFIVPGRWTLVSLLTPWLFLKQLVLKWLKTDWHKNLDKCSRSPEDNIIMTVAHTVKMDDACLLPLDIRKWSKDILDTTLLSCANESRPRPIKSSNFTAFLLPQITN